MRGDPIEAYKMRHRYNSQNLFQTMNIPNTRGHRFKVRGQSLKTHGAGLYSVASASNVLPGVVDADKKGVHSLFYSDDVTNFVADWATKVTASE